MKKQDEEYFDQESNQVYSLHLYITGASPNSARAVANIKNICEKYLPGRHELEIVDVYQEPPIALQAQVIALPMLIKSSPLPLKRLIGDMSDISKVLKGLGLK